MLYEKKIKKFPDILSQSSCVQVDFVCSFKSLESSFENHNSSRFYWSIFEYYILYQFQDPLKYTNPKS